MQTIATPNNLLNRAIMNSQMFSKLRTAIVRKNIVFESARKKALIFIRILQIRSDTAFLRKNRGVGRIRNAGPNLIAMRTVRRS